MKCMHVCAAQKAYLPCLLFTKLQIKPDFPSLADEIAEPHLDMNIKVAAFTVSEKSSNTSCEVCGKSLSDISSLNGHCRTQHQGRRFTCRCGKRF